MDKEIAVVCKHPLGLTVPFQTDGQLAGLLLDLQPDLVRNGLYLPLVSAGADHEVIGKRRHSGEFEDGDIRGFLGFRGAHGYEPCRGGGFGVYGFVQVCLLQNSTPVRIVLQR